MQVLPCHAADFCILRKYLLNIGCLNLEAQSMRQCRWKGLMELEVRVRLNGLLAASAGFKEKTLELPEGTTILEVMGLIALPVGSAWTRSSVNGKLRDKAHVLQDGDELLLFPVGGGG